MHRFSPDLKKSVKISANSDDINLYKINDDFKTSFFSQRKRREIDYAARMLHFMLNKKKTNQCSENFQIFQQKNRKILSTRDMKKNAT